MDVNLMIYDMNNFLNKYTRFMTKDIYISYGMYSKFLSGYDYLYQILKKDTFLYSDNELYKKMMDIINNSDKLVKLHNQKYLQRALKKYEVFFDKIRVKNKLNARGKMLVLSEEENTYVVDFKNYDSLLVGKLKYLIDYKNYECNDILILTSNKEKVDAIKDACLYNNVMVNVLTINDYNEKYLKNNQVLDDSKRYDILVNYIINDLFVDKVKFNSFYKAFSKYIYLNKDYKDYETFKDYHNYMYKRKFLVSKLSLKSFNKSEIKRRKNYLRTINNESLKYKGEVDIANFLYLNSVDYIYDKNEDVFRLLDKNITIKYFNEKEKIEDNLCYLEDVINLYSSYYDDTKSYLGVLAYELIKRRYPLELVSEEDIYSKLRETNIDNYFSEFIYKYLIPLIKYYEENKDLSKVNISELLKIEFLKIYGVYDNYLNENNLITEKEMFKKLEQDLNNGKYKYLFLIGDIKLDCDIPTFTIVDDYRKIELIKNNIKLLYDYKKYLYDNQVIPIMHTYFNSREIDILTKRFLKDNLTIINKYLEEMVNEIEIYEYDDANRLHVYRNIEDICANILEQQQGNVLIAFENLKDVNILMGNNKFTKLDSSTLLTENKKKVSINGVLEIDKLYDTIILPYLIKDNYHDELFEDIYQYNIKVMLYVSLYKCRHKLILLCPSSKINELELLLGTLRKK